MDFLPVALELLSTVLCVGAWSRFAGFRAGIHFDERLGERVTPVSRGVLIFHRPLPLAVPPKRLRDANSVRRMPRRSEYAAKWKNPGQPPILRALIHEFQLAEIGSDVETYRTRS